MASFKLDLNQPEDIPINICMNLITVEEAVNVFEDLMADFPELELSL